MRIYISQQIKDLYNKFISYLVLKWALLLSVFFLPLNLFLNNLLFTVFFVGLLLKILFNDTPGIIKSTFQNYIVILILCSPFIVSLVGVFYTANLPGAFKDLGRLFPLLIVIPLVFYTPLFFHKILNKMLYTLSLGSLLAAFICWAISLLEIYHANGTINDLFTQPYAYHFLSGRVGVHTPYLGLFVSVSIFYLLLKAFEASSKKRTLIHLIWASILFLFLLNLLARTALISLSLGLVAFFLYRRKYILVFAVMAAIASLATIVYVQEQNFLRDRLLNSINIFEEQTIFSKKDDRFHRFKASIEVFKEFPLLGPGTASEDPYRKAVYYDNRDSEAYNENYNAHNQFLEYLSTFGILGGVTFLWIIYVLLKDSFGTKDVFSVFLVFSFIMASLTESVLERSWGISFYLLLLFCIYGNKLIPNEMD